MAVKMNLQSKALDAQSATNCKLLEVETLMKMANDICKPNCKPKG
jgi:hypothetical protein